MQFNVTGENLSNQELSNAILRKKTLINNKRAKGDLAKDDEVELCYLQRQMQMRFYHRRNLLPVDLQNFV